MKIVHCGIFNEYDDGNFFYGMERKISHGLVRNGHFVYDFSYRDWERNLRFLGMKNSGLAKMNAKLVKICQNLKPDILLLGKAEKIATKTIIQIKKILPEIKIAQWYVDHLQEKPEFFEKLNHIDAFFYPNALNLQNLSQRYTKCKFAFIPNISDAAFDLLLKQEKTTDVIYIARDYKEDVRYEFALLLDDFCKKNGIKHKIYGSLGNDVIFGDEFHKAISSSKIAINFNRDDALQAENSQKLLGASDRMAQFMGCGACTFSPRIKGFEKLFEDEKEIVYFDDPQDCFAKIMLYLKDDKFANIAQNGREKTLKIANATRTSKFMIELLFDDKFSQEYEWREFIYQNGVKI